VHPNDYDLWLRGEPDDAAAVLQPYPADDLTAVAVSARVNNPRNEWLRCDPPPAPGCPAG
jgi:putative SOS response-associated peptidase YedK